MKKFDVNINYYDVLGVSKDSTKREIEKKYSELSKAVLEVKKAYVEKYKAKSKEYTLLQEDTENDHEAELGALYDEITDIKVELEACKNKQAELDEARDVLINYKDAYDKAVESAAKKAEKKAEKAAKKAKRAKFDPNVDYYAILGIDKEATEDLDDEEWIETVNEAYDIKKDEYINDDELSDEECDEKIEELDKAKDVLLNYRDKYEEAIHVDSEEESEETEKTANKGRLAIAAIATGVVAALIITAVGAYNLGKNKNKNDVPSNPGITTETTSEPTTENENNTQNTPITVEEVKHGDFTNEEYIEQHVQTIMQNLEANNVINFATGTPYSNQEIKELIQFVNGVYIPETDLEAIAMFDKYLEFVVSYGNLELMIFNPNYMGGEESFLPTIEADARNLQPLNIVDGFVDSTYPVYNFLKVVESKYNEMITSTDISKKTQLETELNQMFIDLEFDGVTINGVTYTYQMIKDNLGAESAYRFYMFLVASFRNIHSQDMFTYESSTLGFDENGNPLTATISYDDFYTDQNMSCLYGTGLSAVENEIYFDETGLIQLNNETGVADYIRYWADINNASLRNYYNLNSTNNNELSIGSK